MAAARRRSKRRWRAATVADLGRIPKPCTLEYISRLPVVTADDPTPLPMTEVIKLIPGYDPHRDAKGYTFDADRARLAIEFFTEVLTHVKGELAKQPLILQLWQQAIVANIFGWVDANGMRRYTDVFVMIPRKNGKTTKCGGIVLFMLFCDGEHGAEVYSAAAELKQAALVFDQAKGMVANHPALKTRARVYRTFKSIEYEEEGSVYRAISGKDDTAHGFNASAYVMDELHAAKNRQLLDVLDTSTGSRSQPLGIIITTADVEGPSICNEKQDLAEKVRDGIVKVATLLPVVYAYPKRPSEKGFKPFTERAWRLANPNFGISVKRNYIRKKAVQAKTTPAFLNTFLRLHLNVRTQSAVAALSIDHWNACARPGLIKKLRGERCWGGIDLAQTQDLNAVAYYFPDHKAFIVYAFVPEDTAAKREEMDDVPYRTWANDPANRFFLTPGNVTDYEIIENAILEHNEIFDVQGWAYDRKFATSVVNNLNGDHGLEMMAFGQGYYSMNEPTKGLLRMIAGQEALHEGSDLLRWCAANLMLDTDPAGSLKPTKARSKDKIDPLVAMIMALGASALDDGEGRSAYEDRGLREL